MCVCVFCFCAPTVQVCVCILYLRRAFDLGNMCRLYPSLCVVYVNVDMHVCLCAHACVHVRVCLCARACVRACVYCVCMRVRFSAFAHACMHV